MKPLQRPRTPRSRWRSGAWVLGLSLLGALGASSPALSAVAGNLGTDFWLSFAESNSFFTDNYELFISSTTATSGTVQVPGIGYSAPFAIPAGATAAVTLPYNAIPHYSDAVSQLGIHVTSLDPVAVTGFNYETASSDGYLALPSGSDGTNYIILTYQDDLGTFPGDFAVAGTVNGTSVTITPSLTVGTHPAGVPYTVSLNQGDVYQLHDGGTTGSDLSGTLVSSDKPVGVWSGNEGVDIPPSASSGNYIVEQLWPLSMWGQEFYTFPLAVSPKGDTFRFLASQDGTTVSVNGSPVTTMNRGQFDETILSSPSQITSDKPIYVMQYANGTSYYGVLYADPSMMSIPPVEEYAQDYLLSIPAATGNLPPGGFPLNYENILVPVSGVGAVSLDGAAIPASQFVSIGSTGYAGTAVTVTAASHHLTGPVSFGAVAYGFGSADGYSYPGGLLAPLFYTPTPTIPVRTPTPTVTPTRTPRDTPTPTVSPTPTCPMNVWPDPFNPKFAHDGEMKVDCLPEGAKVLVFTLAGELVVQLPEDGGMVRWNGTNQKGKEAAPGIYYYVVEGGGQKVLRRGKFLLVR